MSAHRIYLVDDEPLVRRALKQSLESLDVFVVGLEGGAECLDLLRHTPADLLISDVNMPGLDGIALLREVRKLYPLIPILMMSGYADIPMAVQAVKDGASDFFTKPLDETVILPKVRALLESSKRGGVVQMSEVEARVLKYVAEGRSNKEIAFLMERSVRTIENHRHRLMKRLKVGSSAELVRMALTLGLVRSGD